MMFAPIALVHNPTVSPYVPTLSSEYANGCHLHHRFPKISREEQGKPALVTDHGGRIRFSHQSFIRAEETWTVDEVLVVHIVEPVCRHRVQGSEIGVRTVIIRTQALEVSTG